LLIADKKLQRMFARFNFKYIRKTIRNTVNGKKCRIVINSTLNDFSLHFGGGSV